jgi:hypothetical protein
MGGNLIFLPVSNGSQTVFSSARSPVVIRLFLSRPSGKLRALLHMHEFRPMDIDYSKKEWEPHGENRGELSYKKVYPGRFCRIAIIVSPDKPEGHIMHPAQFQTISIN